MNEKYGFDVKQLNVTHSITKNSNFGPFSDPLIFLHIYPVLSSPLQVKPAFGTM